MLNNRFSLRTKPRTLKAKPKGRPEMTAMSAPPATAATHLRHGRRSRRLTPRVPHHVGFWFAAVAFTVLMAFSAAPTPLWPLYAARDGLQPTMVTVAFAMLVIGAATGFLALGHLSDRLGRRRIVVPALALTITAALVMAASPALPNLLAGRFLNGAGIGLMSSTATAYLHDLYREAHRDRPHAALPSLVSPLATMGGLAIGPLAAGAIAQWLPNPLETTQLAFSAAMMSCLGLVLATPETVDARSRIGEAYRRFALRPGKGITFAATAGAGFTSFAVLGLISAIGSLVLRTELHDSSHFVAGLAPFLMFGAAAGGLLVIHRLDWRTILIAGAAAIPIGLAAVTGSLLHPTLSVYLVALVIAGAGAGALFKGAITRAAAVAVPTSRAGVLAVFFVISYMGMGLAPVLFSMVAADLGTTRAMIAFSVALSITGAAAVLPAVSKVLRRTNRDSGAE
ncbi:MFS transporter [Streptomyces sp. NPDC050625]|uniref:MFS transporter n=1 Tax=Streptomyces sp. NPDC050625 TaxID=3154629 RepID=UPI0034329C91